MFEMSVGLWQVWKVLLLGRQVSGLLDLFVAEGELCVCAGTCTGMRCRWRGARGVLFVFVVSMAVSLRRLFFAGVKVIGMVMQFSKQLRFFRSLAGFSKFEIYQADRLGGLFLWYGFSVCYIFKWLLCLYIF